MFRGIKPAKLGSPRDRTLRDMLTKMKVAESCELRAKLAAMLGNDKEASSAYSKYQDSIWYTKVKETRDERMFKEYYETYRNMTPELYRTEDGKAAVRGLS